mmetsp:Transcript_6571/g.8331  ORF Transcript_6571/g.8331 Transcript_6571/m.8331 type:complete len:89 (-) Transcript_6571:57-323(-)
MHPMRKIKNFSQYYAENCAKGGIFQQLCGWLGVAPLWVAAASDSHYQENTNIFKLQKDFAEKDEVDGKIIAFLNMRRPWFETDPGSSR